MTTREILDTYYDLANKGDWDAWCDLFSQDIEMDEQLAGRVEGLEPLREMMSGMHETFTKFQNVPNTFIVEGSHAAVISHISAVVAAKPTEPIEADVVNYFRIEDGKIAYFKNVHDTVPFKPLTG